MFIAALYTRLFIELFRNGVGAGKMSRQMTTALTERALQALEKAKKLMKVADQLLSQGNVKEAERLRKQGRTQRNISMWLMAQANHGNQVIRSANHLYR